MGSGAKKKMKIINCHNNLHLGDCVETLHYLINVVENNEITFNFACVPNYHSQLNEMIRDYSDKIKLVSNAQLAQDSIETWVAGYGDYGELNTKSVELNGYLDQATSFLLHWIRISQIIGVKCPFITKTDLIYNQKVLSEDCLHKQNYDYLFINSVPMSGQCNSFSDYESINFIKRILNKNKTVITTRKIGDIPCTLDHGLSIVEIGKLAKNVKNVVAVNTGPLHLCMNKWSLPNINNFTIWSSAETFGYGTNFKTVKTLGEINESDI
jgi:hypothetical protein